MLRVKVPAASTGDIPRSQRNRSFSQNRNGLVDSMRASAVSEPAPPTGRKLRHLFHRPPVRSVSRPPLYSYSAIQRPVVDGGVKRPASEVVPAQQEMVERRMPRLPSARNLLRYPYEYLLVPIYEYQVMPCIKSFPLSGREHITKSSVDTCAQPTAK